MRRVSPRGAVALLGCCAALLTASGQASGEATPPRGNVLLVTLDTVRADRLGCYGNASIDTPHLDALAADATLFENAFSPVPSTLPSHCSIMTGRYPMAHGVHDNGVYVLEDEAVTLAELLSAMGMRTAAFVSAFVLDAQFRLDQGFAHYDADVDQPLLPQRPEIPAEAPEGRRRWLSQLATAYQRPAGAVTERAIAWVARNGGSPFFLWVHYFDAHQPYAAPAPWTTRYDPHYEGPLDGSRATYRRVRSGERDTGESRDWSREDRHMVARYDGELGYLDSQLGRLFAALREAGHWRETLVVVVADHGESFGEHGVQYWEHNSTVFDDVLRVPLLIRRPDGVGRGRRVAGLVRTIDVAPTVLDWLGASPPEGMQGVSLLGLTGDGDVEAPGEIVVEALRGRQINPRDHSLLGLRTEQAKLMVRFDATGRPARAVVFDLEKDPGERRPTPAARAGRRFTELWKQLTERRRTLSRRTRSTSRELDELTSQALEALGYLE